MSHSFDRGAEARDAIAVLIGRVLLATIFLHESIGKLSGLEGFSGYLTDHGVPAAYSYHVAIVAAVVEFFGSISILVGLMTRYAALLMALFTLVAALIGHRFWEDTVPVVHYNQLIHFLKNAAIIGGYLALYVAGPGPLSVDRHLTRHERRHWHRWGLAASARHHQIAIQSGKTAKE